MNSAFAEFLKQESKQISKLKTLSFRLEGTKIISYKKKSVSFSENIRIPELKKSFGKFRQAGFYK